MKIALFSSLFTNRFSQKSPFLTELVKALAVHVELDVVIPVPFMEYFSRGAPKGTTPLERAIGMERVHYFPFIYLPYISKSYNDLLMWLQARFCCQKVVRSVDLVHAHYLYPDGCCALRLASMHGKPLVVTAHGSDVNVLQDNTRVRASTRELFRKAHMVVFVSEALKKNALDLIGSGNFRVIRNGVDISCFFPMEKNALRRKYGIAENAVVILSVSSLIPLKQVDRLIEAFSELRCPEKHLIVVGDGPERTRLHALARGLSICDKVTFAGKVDHAQIPEFMSLSDMLCIASRSEGWPTILFEALACGCYVVSAPVGGVPEALESEEYGCLAVGDSPADLREALEKGLMIREKGKAARVAYAGDYQWESIAKLCVTVYMELLLKTGPIVNSSVRANC